MQDDLPSSSPTQRQTGWQGSGNPGAVGTARETGDCRIFSEECRRTCFGDKFRGRSFFAERVSVLNEFDPEQDDR